MPNLKELNEGKPASVWTNGGSQTMVIPAEFFIRSGVSRKAKLEVYHYFDAESGVLITRFEEVSE